MRLAPVLLEEWMRLYYFAAEIDLGSSGVENFSIADLRRLLGFGLDEIDRLVLRDSESLGGPGIRRALAGRFLGGRIDRVLVTHGSSEAIYLILGTLLSAGDEVVVLDPCYPQHFGIAEALGCRLVRWPLRFERGFRPDLEEMRRLVRPGTRMVIVNFPNNPTGATLRPAELDELVRRVEEVGALLVWDGAFSELTYDAPALPEPALASDRVLSIGTLSKAYGLPGLRVGWCLAAPELLRQMIQTRDHVTLHLSPLVELVAEKAIDGGDVLVGMRREQARHNRGVLAAWVAQQEGRVEWVPPEGGVTAFARLPRVPDVEAFCHRLAAEHKLLLVPGACFGRPQHVRLGFGDATAGFEEGLGRLSRALAAVP